MKTSTSLLTYLTRFNLRVGFLNPLLAAFLLLMWSPGDVVGQSTTKQAPDCQVFFSFTASGSTSALANYGTGGPQGPALCTTWTLGYASTGFTGLTLAVQSAPAGTAVAPGTWVTYAGTVSTGSNPNTSTVGAQTTLSNGVVGIPWVRVTLSGTTGAGQVFGLLQGWNSGNAGGGGGGSGGSGCVGTIGTPCVVAGETPGGVAAVVETDVNGRLLQGAYALNAPLSVSTSGLTRIITHSGTTTTTIAHLSISFTGATDFQIEYGTGTNCGTGTTALSGLYKTTLAVALDVPFFVPSGQDVCVNLGTAVTGGGLVVYAQP